MAGPLRTLLNDLAFPEGPRWHEGELYFSDMHSHEVVAMTAEGTRRTAFRHAGPVSGLGWLPDGRMLVVSMDDRRLLRIERDGKATLHADLSPVATHQANDMVVDAKGRAYVGNFGYGFPDEAPRPARMARVDPDGSVHEAASNLLMPNGTVITPDGRTLIVGEAVARQLTAFDVGADGSLSNRRVWAALKNGDLLDGICLDAEGAIWCASPVKNEVIRVREGGAVVERIKTSQSAFACMLGGEGRRTLFALTAKTWDPASCKAVHTGKIEATQVDVPGAGLP